MKDILAQALTSDKISGEFSLLPLIYRDIIDSLLSFAEHRGFLPFTAKLVKSPNKFWIAKLGLFKDNLSIYIQYELFVDPDDPNSDGVQIISKSAPIPILRSTSGLGLILSASEAFDITEYGYTSTTIHPTDPDILDKLNLIFK